MVGGVEQRQDAAEAVAEQIDLFGAGNVAHALDRGGKVVVDVVLELVGCVAFVGHSPVQEVDVESGCEEPFDEAVARLQVENVAAREQAEHNQEWRRHPDVVVAVVPQLSSAASPHHVLRGRADLGSRAAGRHPNAVARPQRIAFHLPANPVDDARRA